MGRTAGLVTLIVFVAACGGGAQTAARSPSPSPSATAASASPGGVGSPSENPPTPSAGPSPSPVPQVVCQSGAPGAQMVLIGSKWTALQLLYDVTDPVRPRLLCKITNTSAHLFTGDTFEYLKPVSATETDVMLHSLGSGNESHAGKFPFYATSGSWLPDQTVMVYTRQRSVDEGFPTGGVDVYLYARRQTGPLFTYHSGIGDCICRFGLPPEVLAISPDGQYVAAGHLTGKGSEPIAVYRVSDRALVTTLDPSVMWVFWDRSGHRLFLDRFGAGTAQSWTPEAGVSGITGAGAWSYLPGLSPDGNLVAYTAYLNPNDQSQPRVYVYDLKAGTTKPLIDQLRTQVLFVKNGWVWYLEERVCTSADRCPGATMPSGKVYAMNLSTATEQEVSWAFGDDPHGQGGNIGWGVFGPGEFWPAA